jgi:MFS family permease
VFQALWIPDFRRLWGGGLISSLGSWLLVLAIPAHILAVTGSLRDTGLTLAAEYLPQLVLGPVAGAVADGWDRRRLMIGANLFCAGAVTVMLLGTSPGRYWVLYAALIAESSGSVLYAPALQARVPAIVGTGPLLSSANSLTSASSGIVRLIGGPLGGVLLAVCGIRWLICADAFSYLLAAVAMFMTSRSGRGHRDRTAVVSALTRDLIEGTRVLRAQPVARVLLPVTVIFLTANASLSAVLIPFGFQRLGGSEHTGLLLSCLGAGFLLGAPVIRAFLDRAGPRNLLTASLTATAGAYFLLFTSSSLATALPAAAAVAMSGSMTLVIQQTVLQRVIPGAVLGRVSAVFLTGEAAATLIGSVAGPFLAQAAHLVALAAAASLVTISAAALALLTVPQMPAIVTCSPPLSERNARSVRPRTRGLLKRLRVGGLGQRGEPARLAADQHYHGHDRDDRDADEDPVDDARGLLQRVPGQVGSKGIDRGPQDPARGVGGQEPPPAHLAGSGEERRVGAQHGHEPAEEHHLGAMAVEQVTGDLQLLLVQPDLGPVAAGQPVAALVADPVADVVPDDRGRRRHQED